MPDRRRIQMEKRNGAGEKKRIRLFCRPASLKKEQIHFIVEFSWTPPQLHFAEVLHALGSIPLPPYLKREAEAADTERYQTIYATEEGSVAAPTAGLHFTAEIFNSLRQKQIKRYTSHFMWRRHIHAGEIRKTV